jgi:hypothetical protein
LVQQLIENNKVAILPFINSITEIHLKREKKSERARSATHHGTITAYGLLQMQKARSGYFILFSDE